jgi:histone acetyltransferase (RNA polymerase elongator complex component)
MEIGDKEHDNLEPILAVRKYTASKGREYHISIEAHTMSRFQKLIYYLMGIYMYLYTLCTGLLCYWPGDLESYIGLYGFLRLRLDQNPGGGYIPELHDCALIREVHVYGTSMGVGVESDGSQHRGHGKLLMATAEKIAKAAGWSKVAVIAGVGTREYYKNKCGYRLVGTYMIKDI